MMSSMGSSRGNTRSGGRGDKSSSQKTTTQNATTKSTPTEPQQPVGKKATQEQLRFAQIISDSRTEDNEMVKEKVQKVHELTNRSEDEIMVALHDSNYDTEQAIILLLEREEGNQKDEWETISSKKSKVRGMAPSMRSTDSFNNHQDKDHKTDDDRRDRGGRGRNRDGNRESRDGQDGRGDREGSYGRGRGRGGRGNLPPRMTRGRGRDRDNDYDRDRNDRNESGRGRGRRNQEMNGPSRRSNRGGQRSFTNSKFGTYNQEEDAFKSTDNVWRNPPATESWDDAVNSNAQQQQQQQQPTKTGEWGAEEWGAEDWTGDLTESQVFTATNPVPPMPLDPISASPSQMQAPVGQPPSSGLSNQGMPPPSHAMDGQSSLAGPPGVMPGGGGVRQQPVGGSIGQSAGNIGPPAGSIGQHSGGMMQGMVGQSQGGMPSAMSSSGMSAGGMSGGGLSGGGMSASGMSSGGMSSGGMSAGGMSSAGMSSGGMSSSGLPASGMSSGSIPSGGMSSGGMPSGTMSSTGMSSGNIGPPPGGMAVGGSVIGQGGMNANMQANTTMPDMTRNITLEALFGKSVQPPTTSLGVSDPVFGKSVQPPTTSLGVNDPSSSVRDSSSVFSQFRDPSKTPPQTINSMSEQQNKQVQMVMDQSQGQLPASSRAPVQSKPTRKKLPPPSTKIPASAVEMPNSARGLGALDVQFGAMDITMDPAVSDFGLSSSSMPSSMSSTLSTSGGLSNSAFSVNSQGTSANHLSYTKSNEPQYPASTGMSPVGMSANTPVSAPPSSVAQPSLDPSQQRGPSHYGQGAPQKQITPEPIPLPNQNEMKTNSYLTSQSKPPSVPSLDNKDKTSSQLSQLASLSSSSGFGLSTSQSLGGGANRQVPNSYGSPGLSSSSGIQTTSTSQYQAPDLSSGGTSAFSTPMGSSSLSAGPASGTVGSSSLSSGPSTIGYSSPSQAAGSLSSGGVLPSSVSSVGSAGSTGGSSSLSSSGHLSNSMSSSSSVSQATSTLPSSKLAALDARQVQSSLGSNNLVSGNLNNTSSSSVLSSTSSSTLTSSSSLGYTTSTTTTAGLTGTKSVSQGSAKLPPNLPPGMPFMYHPNLISTGFPLVNPIPTHQPYMYEDFQMQIGRLPMPFQQLATTTLNTGRDTNSLGNTPYSVTEASKFPRNDAASPVATSLATQQPHQPQTAGSALAGQGAHHQTQTQQQTPFLNTTLPPGYPGYSTLPYYAAGPGLMPPGLQYPAAVFPAVSTVQPSNRAQTGTTPHSAFQQSGYTQPASHNAYGTGYDELTPTPDFSKGGYNSVSQSQSKGSGVTAPVSSASTGPADLVGSSYSSKSHTQPFENKGGFHTGTPPPFNYPLTAVTQAGALNPAAAAGAAQPAHYAPFVPILPHHSAAMLAHQLPGDTQGAGSTGRTQGGASQSSKPSKPSYGTNYWPN